MLGRAAGPGLEWTFVGLAVLLGVGSLGHSYRALHRSRWPLALFTTGFTLLMGGRLVENRLEIPDLALVFPAASLIVTAHVLNVRLRKRAMSHAGCACPCHDE
jgi:hypothetical protein